MIVESVRHPLLPRAIICVLLGVISALQSCETKILEDDDAKDAGERLGIHSFHSRCNRDLQTV